MRFLAVLSIAVFGCTQRDSTLADPPNQPLTKNELHPPPPTIADAEASDASDRSWNLVPALRFDFSADRRCSVRIGKEFFATPLVVMDLDPGEHEFVVRCPDRPDITKRFMIRASNTTVVTWADMVSR